MSFPHGVCRIYQLRLYLYTSDSNNSGVLVESLMPTHQYLIHVSHPSTSSGAATGNGVWVWRDSGSRNDPDLDCHDWIHHGEHFHCAALPALCWSSRAILHLSAH